MVVVANPGGPGHGWICKRHVFAAAPWKPYTDASTGREFINCPSTYRDNPNLDRGEYARQLAAACSTDPELLKAWDHGDWTVARGAFFSAVLDHSRVMVERWPFDFGPRDSKHRDGWSLYLAHDFGVSAPSVTYVVAKSPGIVGPDGRYYPRGSKVLLDELATNEPNSLERGMGYTVPVLADRIKELAKRLGHPARGRGRRRDLRQDGFRRRQHCGRVSRLRRVLDAGEEGRPAHRLGSDARAASGRGQARQARPLCVALV